MNQLSLKTTSFLFVLLCLLLSTTSCGEEENLCIAGGDELNGTYTGTWVGINCDTALMNSFEIIDGPTEIESSTGILLNNNDEGFQFNLNSVLSEGCSFNFANLDNQSSAIVGGGMGTIEGNILTLELLENNTVVCTYTGTKD